MPDDYRIFLPPFLVQNEKLTLAQFAALVAEKYRVAKLLAPDQIEINEALVLTDPAFVLRGKEIYAGKFPRLLDIPGSNPPGMPSISFRCPDLQIINCHFHDLASVGWWEQSSGVMKGCLVDNIGWDAPDRGHGHSLYTQGSASRPKRIEGCIFVKGFGDNFTLYGSSESTLMGYEVVGNIIHGYRLLVGGSDVQNVTVNDNFIYGGVQLGYNTRQNKQSGFTHNILIGNLGVNLYWSETAVRQNLIVGDVTLPYGMFYDRVDWNENVYVGTRFTFDKHPTLKGKQTFDKWKTETGWDKTSRWYATPQDAAAAGELSLPLVDYKYVREGGHEANLAIWNPAGSSLVSLIPDGFADGEYELRQVRDLDDARGVVVDQQQQLVVPLGMFGEVAPPLYAPPASAWVHPTAIAPSSFPQVGVFELWKV